MSDLQVLYFDLECRPGHWIGGDYVSKVITAAAWYYDDDIEVMTHYNHKPGEIAEEVANLLALSDMCCGHYIRGFDLPLLSGELLRNKMPPLEAVLSLDTKQDLNKAHGRSLSQKNLAAQLEIPEPKVDVSLAEWEGFNAREDGFEEKVIERVKGDVIQNIALRRALNKIGWLNAPQVWRPDKQSGGTYRP